MPNRAAVSASAFDAHVMHAQVARNKRCTKPRWRAACRACHAARSPISSLMGAVPARDRVARAPVGAACGTGYVRCAASGSQAQGRHGRDQLECRARRILAVARAVEQFVRRGRGLRAAGGSGGGRAHQRQHVAGGRAPSPPPRPSLRPPAAGGAPGSRCARSCRRISRVRRTLRSRARMRAIAGLPG